MLILSNSRKGFLDGRKDDFQMPYILTEKWNGIDRLTEEWCRRQAESIARVVHGFRDHKVFLREDFFDGDFFAEDFDSDGLIAFLNEMAVKDYKSASSLAFRMMSHLLYVHTSPDNPAVNHWLDEIDNFGYAFADAVGVDRKHELGNTNIRNKLRENWSDIYEKAVRQVLTKAKRYSTAFNFDTASIPVEVVWTVEDFLTRNTEELVEMLHQ